MIDRSYNGDWFLPNGIKYPGSLSINKETGEIVLEIYSNKSIEGYEINFPYSKQEYYHKYIHGDGQGGPYTLYHCRLGRCSLIGKNFFKTEYHIEFIINGTLISRPEGLMIRSAKFLYPNLASWYDGYQSLGRLNGIHGNLTEFNRTETENLQLNEQLELIFTDHTYSSMKDINVSYTLNYNKYLTFKYSTDVPFSQLLKDSTTFLKLLSFSYSKPQYCKIISIDIADEFTDIQTNSQYNHQDYNRYYLTNFSLHKNKSVPVKGAHQNNMIISAWKLTKEELNQVIIKWYKNTQYVNIVEHYLDSNNWFEDYKDVKLTNVMFNNRFLNLVQGLEDIYREDYLNENVGIDENQFNEKKHLIMNDIKDKQLKQWLNNTFKFTRHPRLEDKLAVITKACLPLVVELFGEISFDGFPISAKNFRNQLSHGINKETNLGDELNLDFHIAKIILLLSIIKTLDIYQPKTVLSNHHELGRNIKHIRLLQEELRK